MRDSQDQWVLLNDAAAPTVVSFQEVQRKQAYILVFRLLATTQRVLRNHVVGGAVGDDDAGDDAEIVRQK